MADDALARLYAMLSPDTTTGVSGGAGPFSFAFNESRPKAPTPWWERPPEPARSGNIAYTQDMDPLIARIMASGSVDPNTNVSTISPSLNLRAGPINLGGGFTHVMSPEGSTTRPNFNFGLNQRLGDSGGIGANFSTVPGQSRTFSGSGTYNLTPEMVISALLSHTMNDDPRSKPNTFGGLSFKYNFPAGRNPYER
jgi:hypothetical protein